VPAYDFNWQTGYRFVEPKPFPKGTRIHCVAHFDNSEKNLNNPNPDDRVKWGTQTWDEMLIGYFDIAIPKDQATRPSPFELRAEELIVQFDKNFDDKVERREAPLKFQIVFAQLDLDSNGELTAEEVAEAMEKYKDQLRGRRGRRNRE
ncbi:MAG: alkyl hydroperoxide reductase, partial [Planctomycetaceae bacterium]|nr:alkyl hydroperoxide reductase [Planctomycetaceae bacterium]